MTTERDSRLRHGRRGSGLGAARASGRSAHPGIAAPTAAPQPKPSHKGVATSAKLAAIAPKRAPQRRCNVDKNLSRMRSLGARLQC
ncbi:hypothetical protein OAO87_01915 [bacterium]|nr:hypothetical protein [bacterium]